MFPGKYLETVIRSQDRNSGDLEQLKNKILLNIKQGRVYLDISSFPRASVGSFPTPLQEMKCSNKETESSSFTY